MTVPSPAGDPVDMTQVRVDVFTRAVHGAPPNVVVTHIPSGLMEKCDETGSVAANREIAVKRLTARLT